MPEEKDRLILADGITSLHNSRCGYAERDLWCWIKGDEKDNLNLIFRLFTDPSMTREITYRGAYSRRGIRYKGFTEFLLIKKGEDSIDVRLTWPEGGEHSKEEIVDEAVSLDV